jgi:hypothetical protein
MDAGGRSGSEVCRTLLLTFGCPSLDKQRASLQNLLVRRRASKALGPGGPGSHEQIKELRHRYTNTLGHKRNMHLNDHGGVKSKQNRVGLFNSREVGRALRGAKQEWRS